MSETSYGSQKHTSLWSSEPYAQRCPLCVLSGSFCCGWADYCGSAGMQDWPLDKLAARSCFLWLLLVCWCFGSGPGMAGCTALEVLGLALAYWWVGPGSSAAGCSVLGVPGLVFTGL